MQADRFDLLAPDRCLLAGLRGHVLFTNYVLEQLPTGLPAALETLLAAAPREVLHLEPCVELLDPRRSLLDLASYLHVRAADYQRSLLTELRRRERAGELSILEVGRLGYAPRAAHPPALIRWQPAR